jgi:hypothetical protein
MNFRFLRPSMLLALALGLSACGGDKASYDINVDVTGLNYADLVLTDKISGITYKVAKPTPAGKTVSLVFPRKLEYGDEFHILIDPANQPAHQDCKGELHDSAGRMSSIKAVFVCKDFAPRVYGTISIIGVADAAPTGLTLTNGSMPAFKAVAGSKSYAFESIPYSTFYGLTIAKQPDDGKSKCRLVLITPQDPPRAVTPDGLSFTGQMGDANVAIDVVCGPP